jgi:hypothetical protein
LHSAKQTAIAIKMEGAFTHLGNHLISDSAAAINAGDDLSTIDPDEGPYMASTEVAEV